MINHFGMFCLKNLPQFWAAKIYLVKPGFGVQVRLATGDQAVNHCHIVPGINQLIDYVRANKTGAACNTSIFM